MLIIDPRTLVATVDEHDEIVVRYRRLLPGGVPSGLNGERWAFVIWGGGIEPATAVGVRDRDDEGWFTEMRHDAGLGGVLAGNPRLQWKIGEVLPSGAIDTRYVGRLVVTPSPAADATPPTLGGGDILMIEESEDDE